AGEFFAIGTSSRINLPLLTTPNFTLTRITLVGSVVPMMVPKFPTPPVTPSPTVAVLLDGLMMKVLSMPPPFGDNGPAPGAAPTLRSSITVPLTNCAVPALSTMISDVEFNALKMAVKLPVPQPGVELRFLASPVATDASVGAATWGPHSVDRLSTLNRIPLMGRPELLVYLTRSISVPSGLLAGSAIVGSGMNRRSRLRGPNWSGPSNGDR